MASVAGKKGPTVTVADRSYSHDSSSSSSEHETSRGGGGARFADPAAQHSPVEHTESFQPVPQPGDVGFGYINDRRSLHAVPHIEIPSSPLKSAMRVPGAPPRNLDDALKSPKFAPSIMMSPTWREEKLLERKETKTTKEQAHDLKVKVRVRVAKLLLRFTNFSCSLIVLAMLSTTLTVFNATVNLPPRNALPAWSPGTPKWPQIVMLVVACISLFFSVVILIAYCKGGHRRVQKWQTYYTCLAVAFFMLSILMWAVSAGIFQHVRNQPGGNDMWGWSCKHNAREQIFGDDVPYNLLCRLQNWSLVCAIIEVVVECITILVYGVVFYRFWSKRNLRRTMAARDKARSELYMSQLRSGPTSPALPTSPGAPLSPREGGYNPMYSPRFASNAQDPVNAAERGEAGVGEGSQFASLSSALHSNPGKQFQLSKPPMKSPKLSVRPAEGPADAAATTAPAPKRANPLTITTTQVPAAPQEPRYDTVPIPGAYTSPLTSPTVAGAFQRPT